MRNREDLVIEKDVHNGETPLKANEQEALGVKYEPTTEDLENMKMKPDHFKISGDGVFHTIQGEGSRQGRPITFIRLQHCNLACAWCDAWYTWKSDTEEFWKGARDLHIDSLRGEIIKAQSEVELDELVPHILWTGGEPLLQQRNIRKFMERNLDFTAEVETNGIVMPNTYLMEQARNGRVEFNVSPKLISSYNREEVELVRPKVLRALASIPSTDFKFVCSTPDDIEEVLEVYSEVIPKRQITIMPEGVTKERNQQVYERIMPLILKYGLRTHNRTHTVMFEEAKRKI